MGPQLTGKPGEPRGNSCDTNLQAYEIPGGFRLWARVSRNRPEVTPKLQVAACR